jgi:hypothetical protein
MKKMWVLAVLAAGCMALAGCGIGYEPGNQETSDTGYNSELKNGTVEIEDACSSIQIESDIADIRLEKGERLELNYSIDKDNVLNWKVENGKLFVKETPKKKFGFFFRIGIVEDSYIVLTLPEQEWEKIAAVSDIGNVFMDGISAGQIRSGSDTGEVEIANGVFSDGKFENDTGNMKITGSEFNDLDLANDTGDILVEDSRTDTLWMECDTGDINLKKTAFTKADFENDNGLIEALACTGKTVIGNNNTGDIQLQVSNIERMDLETDTGEIKLALEGTKNDYNIVFESDTGRLNMERGSERGWAEIDNGSDRQINLRTDTGDAEIDFDVAW